MPEFLQPLLAGGSWKVALLALLTSFLLCTWIAGLYAWTYRGMSYSRNMVQSLALAGIVACILMLAIGDNLTRGLGIIGTLALIRFRTNLRDPWDMIFVFSVFAVGIAAGTQAYGVAVMGTLVFSSAVLLMRHSSFGARQQFDGLLRLHLPNDPAARQELTEILSAHCREYVLVTLKEVAQGQAQEHAYHLRLWRPDQQPVLLEDLATLPGARAVTLHMQEATVEL